MQHNKIFFKVGMEKYLHFIRQNLNLSQVHLNLYLYIDKYTRI